MHDIFFVSYAEPNADQNWEILRDRFPHARRVHGVKGIDVAHKKCASLSYTKMFWTVDGDTVVNDDWDFTFDPDAWDTGYVHIWYSRNPVNGLEYGYGSVKLWPRSVVIAHENRWTDFTTSFSGIKVIPSVVAETRFNSSPFEAWKSAFRECIKLMSAIRGDPDDTDSIARLKKWTTTFDESQEFHEYVRLGTVDAANWYDSGNDISIINDFSLLEEHFRTYTLGKRDR